MSPLMVVAFLASCGGSKPTPPEPEAKDIATDSWETFCYYANKGEEAFKEAYKIEDLKALIDPLNKTGKQLYRDVTISIHGVTVNAPVRLIGINHDTISESNEEKKALFTFEFKDCVLSNVPYGFDPINVTYQDSFVRACCETIFEGLPQELTNSIKTVNKDTYNYNEFSEDPMEDGKMETTKEKLFLLSDYEVNGEEDTSDPMKPLEGKPYDLYKAIQYEQHEDIRVKLMPNAKDEWDYCNYWLRSPYLVTGDFGDKVTGAWAVYSEGNNGDAAGYKQNEEPTSEYFYLIGIAPAFCI